MIEQYASTIIEDHQARSIKSHLTTVTDLKYRTDLKQL